MAQTQHTMNLDTLIPIIVAAIASLPGLLALNGQKNRADAASTYQKIATDAATDNQKLRQCVEDLEARIDTLEAQWTDAEEYVQRLSDAYDELVMVMRGAGLQPVHPKPARKVRAVG